MTITITGVTDNPVAQPDVASTTENVAISVDVLANDIDKDGDVIVFDPENEDAELLFAEDSLRRNEEVDAVFLGIGNGELKLLDPL